MNYTMNFKWRVNISPQPETKVLGENLMILGEKKKSIISI